jgi:hypothetical protein
MVSLRYLVSKTGLLIRSVQKASDEGIYTCQAVNVVGQRSMTGSLIVYSQLSYFYIRSLIVTAILMKNV